MLANLNDVLRPAKEQHYAVGLFNSVTLEMTDAIFNAAEKLNAPVIMGTAEILLPSACGRGHGEKPRDAFARAGRAAL